MKTSKTKTARNQTIQREKYHNVLCKALRILFKLAKTGAEKHGPEHEKIDVDRPKRWRQLIVTRKERKEDKLAVRFVRIWQLRDMKKIQRKQREIIIAPNNRSNRK